MKILRSNSGASIIEFGLVLPILVLILVGAIEISRLALIQLKLDKFTNAMADFATQEATTPSKESLDNFASTGEQFMKPFLFSGTVIFNSISTSTNGTIPGCVITNPCYNIMQWQYRAKGVEQSRLGGAGQQDISLPGNYRVVGGYNVVAVEVFYNYAPLLSGSGGLIPALGPQTLYKIAVFKPRQGTFSKPPE